MTDLRSQIAALSPERRALLESRLARLMAERGPRDGRITPRDRSTPTPLGLAQQREWASERVRGANNITAAFRVEGTLDLDLLGTVLTEVVERHEVLRTTVRVGADGAPVQLVGEVARVTVPVVDLGQLSPEEQHAEARRRYAAELTRAFGADDPLRLRVTLLRLSDETHLALFAIDHVVSDAWSMAILVQEIATLYAVHRHGGPRPPAPPVQFGDFAAWQRERLTPERTAAELRHWQETLAGIPGGLGVPTDRPYPTRPTYVGDVQFTNLSPQLSADLRRLGDQQGASLSMVLLAAASVLLHRYLERDDLVLVSMASGRNRVETEQLIGCFANPLPLRLRVRDDDTLLGLVQQAREVMATALDHQDVPLERLIEAVGLDREASQTSLSGMWVNALTGPDMTLELPGLRISIEPIHLGIAPVALTLVAVPNGDRLQLQWLFMTELFDAGTVALLADQFERVLQRLLAEPGSTVGQVSLAPAASGAAAAPVAGDVGPGFVELLRRRTASAPHAPAVVCDGVPTSYADLSREAGRLARRLRQLGVTQESRVGILLDRSPRLAVAVCGVLEAGGAYVPLDASYPTDRLAFQLSDAGIGVLVAERRTAELLTAAGVPLPGQVVLLDGPAAEGDGPEPPAPHPDSAAYVVYTSGSTGQPKGAVITHRSLVTFGRDVADRLGLGAGDRFLQFASPAFDVLVEELFPIWLAGGAVVTSSEPVSRLDLVELIERERITVIELPTAYWHEWVRELDRLDRKLPSCLRLVIIGGERVLPERLTRWRRHAVPLLHVYGLTEATCSSTFFRLDPADPEQDWPNLPIGTPIPSADLRVLDSRLRPAPRGGTGELYVAGVSLARGYLDRPGLTAQRFVADPDPAHPGQRLYRTGDLVRERADGNLEFIARVDTQIHIRGFRVEPTEIESALSRHPAVTESVVAMHEPVAGDRRLVAYVVPHPGQNADVRELRLFLEAQLPPYMVPSSFVELDALPLSANGKIDRDRLPAPAQRPTGEPSAGAATEIEQTLASVIAAVIGLDQVGPHDNFFEIGGDSILAIQVVARAQEAGLALTPYDLFAHPTVAALAGIAEAAAADTPPTPAEPETSAFPLARADDDEIAKLLKRL
ncbi:non-ribosomal peptide synthetase [Micromonospora chokoriensis]|uniref:non-ribosomal peptide synthetase n=1 Tax=Micromonospora chokoriensis TaxID=356851 RepID=UPI00068AF8BA|nr:non-ribosomal peptide synthetase [Micromonospora chokoriensis]